MTSAALRPLTCLFVSLLLAPAARAANQVWIVAGQSGGGDFTTVQAAIDAATDGDIILVRDGTHGAPVVDNKSLTIERDAASANEPGFDGLTVKNLAFHQKVVLRDLRIGSNNLTFYEVDVTGCAGPVFIEECELFLRVKDSAHVVVTNSVLRGTAGSDITNPLIVPGVALRVEGSECSVYDSLIVGGRGGSAGFPPFQPLPVPSQPSAAGVEFSSSAVLLAKCNVHGGTGGGGALIGGVCVPSSDGAPAVIAGGPVTLVETHTVAGGVGPDPAGCPPGGVAPPPIVVTTGSVTTVAELVPRLFVTSPNALGSQVFTEVRGQPGEFALLLVSLQPNGAYVPAVTGALVGGAPLLAVPLGPLDANGELSWFTPLAPNLLPPGVEGVQIYEQVAVPGSGGFGLLGSPSFLVIHQ